MLRRRRPTTLSPSRSSTSARSTARGSSPPPLRMSARCGGPGSQGGGLRRSPGRAGGGPQHQKSRPWGWCRLLPEGEGRAGERGPPPPRPWLTCRAGWRCCTRRLATSRRRRSCRWTPGGQGRGLGGGRVSWPGQDCELAHKPWGPGPGSPPFEALLQVPPGPRVCGVCSRACKPVCVRPVRGVCALIPVQPGGPDL